MHDADDKDEGDDNDDDCYNTGEDGAVNDSDDSNKDGYGTPSHRKTLNSFVSNVTRARAIIQNTISAYRLEIIVPVSWALNTNY